MESAFVVVNQGGNKQNNTNNQAVDHLDLPPGFRFKPTDEEIITYYLIQKVINSNFTATAIGEVDLNRYEPWDLPKKAKMGEKEWYFFCQRSRKYPTGMRTNRATESGYWKATGKDKEIYSNKKVVGMKKTLVFYKGRAPKGEKLDWVIHEFRLEGSCYNFPNSTKDAWVISRVVHKKTTTIIKPSSMLDITRMNSFVEGLLDSPSLPLLMNSPFSKNNEKTNASNSTNIDTTYNDLKDSSGTSLATYNTTSFNTSTDALISTNYHMPNSLCNSQNPYYNYSTSTLRNLLHQQRFDHMIPNFPGADNPRKISGQALQRHCEVERFSTNQSQDTGLITEISSSKQEDNWDNVGRFSDTEDYSAICDPLSDLDSFWSY